MILCHVDIFSQVKLQMLIICVVIFVRVGCLLLNCRYVKVMRPFDFKKYNMKTANYLCSNFIAMQWNWKNLHTQGKSNCTGNVTCSIKN